jgi:hypothetical protein
MEPLIKLYVSLYASLCKSLSTPNISHIKNLILNRRPLGWVRSSKIDFTHCALADHGL